jgi:hypothetical protein
MDRLHLEDGRAALAEVEVKGTVPVEKARKLRGL